MSNLNDCSGFNKVNLDVKENWNNKDWRKNNV